MLLWIEKIALNFSLTKLKAFFLFLSPVWKPKTVKVSFVQRKYYLRREFVKWTLKKSKTEKWWQERFSLAITDITSAQRAAEKLSRSQNQSCQRALFIQFRCLAATRQKRVRECWESGQNGHWKNKWILRDRKSDIGFRRFVTAKYRQISSWLVSS